MKSTNVATVSELNAAYAKLLTAKDSKDIDAVDALNNAMGMTYDALGELLGKYNKDLETFMRNPSSFGLEKIGAGKVRIKDFSKFASEMGWKAGSEEYVSAYKTYNSSLIEYNKHITDEIKSEFDSLLNAKIGDEIDLTRIVSEFGEDKISALLTGYGATIKDGILTITETDYDKRAELYRKIGQLAVTNGAMLETEFQATMD